jgi:hypothetical protein
MNSLPDLLKSGLFSTGHTKSDNKEIHNDII